MKNTILLTAILWSPLYAYVYFVLVPPTPVEIMVYVALGLFVLVTIAITIIIVHLKLMKREILFYYGLGFTMGVSKELNQFFIILPFMSIVWEIKTKKHEKRAIQTVFPEGRIFENDSPGYGQEY